MTNSNQQNAIDENTISLFVHNSEGLEREQAVVYLSLLILEGKDDKFNSIVKEKDSRLYQLSDSARERILSNLRKRAFNAGIVNDFGQISEKNKEFILALFNKESEIPACPNFYTPILAYVKENISKQHQESQQNER
jgi:hypothetical protein